MNRQTVAMILAKGKALAPDRFPAIPTNDDAAEVVLEAWRESLSIVSLPHEVWSAAVTMWATSMVEDRMVTPRDMIKAAYLVRDRWEQHPERKALLEEFRLSKLNGNYQRMGLEPVPVATLDAVAGGRSLPIGDGGDGKGLGRMGDLLQFGRVKPADGM